MAPIAKYLAITGLAGLTLANPVDLEKRKIAFTIPQVTGNKYFLNGPAALAKAYGKYTGGVPSNVNAAAATAQKGSVTATPEQYDSEYLCPVTVGSQTLNLDFDTGSADLWVFSNLQPSSQRSGHSIYTTSSSKRLSGETWSITYGDGSGASGVVYADKVVIGSVTATTQAVEAATSVSSSFVQDTDNDGLVGFAFSTINTVTPDRQNTWFDTVKSTLASKVFCADLKKGTAGKYDIGFVDTSAYSGALTYVSVDSSNGFWGFTASGWSAGSKSGGSISGIADTGTTLLLLSNTIVTSYYSQVSGATNSNTYGGWIFPCSATLPAFSVTIGGTTHTIPSSYMNYAPVTSSQCYGGLQSNSGIGFSIFGDIFLKSQYVCFDENQSSPRIGFANQ